MREALDKADRDIVYSLCQYGMGDVWKWGAEVGGNCWRTTGDISDSWGSMAGIGFAQNGHEKFAGPGHWNDPDMLVVGMVGWGNLHPTGLTPNEQYTHISLWCLLASPLLIGCDMAQLDDFTLGLLTNDEVLEVNQDPLGKQAARVGPERRPRSLGQGHGGRLEGRRPVQPRPHRVAGHGQVVRPGHRRQADRPRPVAAERPRRVRDRVHRQGRPARRGVDSRAA